jgi:hypothetical protein
MRIVAKLEAIVFLVKLDRALTELECVVNRSADDDPTESSDDQFETEGTPTITSIRVRVDYTRTLVEMRNATKCDGYVNPDLNDVHLPVEVRESGERELVLVCFHREVGDNEDPAKSELLRELDMLGLQPEGPPEIFAVGEHHPELQLLFPIVARRQVWRDPLGLLRCPILYCNEPEREVDLPDIQSRWSDDYRFLASRKPTPSK